MNTKLTFIFCFATIFVMPFIVPIVQASNTKCIPCNDIQHAAMLIALEKRIEDVDQDFLLELDEKARCWYEKFQNGGFFYNGWQQISEDVVARVVAEEKLKARITMLALGVRIGCEWSKENDVRKISTQMLRKWGEKLRSTATDSSDNILVVISTIEYEVNQLLLKM
jgi:hypothetical protein